MKFKDWFTEKKLNETFLENGADTYDENQDGQDGGSWYNDDDKYTSLLKKEKKKQKVEKKFNVGDVIVLTNNERLYKMPQDAHDFLMTYKTFTVKSINDKGKINLGCRISKNEDGRGVEKIYMFSASRFDLLKPSIKPLE